MRQLKSQRRGTTKATRYLGCAASLTASAVGDRSLVWVCHVTGTPGCSTANVRNQHSWVTTVVAPKRVPTPTNGVFPASPTKNSGKTKDSATRQDHYMVKR